MLNGSSAISEFIYSFERIFGHINIRKNNQKSFTVLVECMKLLADQSYNLRAEFRQVDGLFLLSTLFCLWPLLTVPQTNNLKIDFCSERFPEIVQRYGGDVDVGEEIVSRMVQILRDAGDMRAEDVSETVLHTAGALVGSVMPRHRDVLSHMRVSFLRVLTCHKNVRTPFVLFFCTCRVTTDSFQESVICVVLVNCICVGNDFVKAVAQTQVDRQWLSS